MFWNDPTLYSTTLPYKEFGHMPFPGINPFIPKFVPPTFGTLPYDFRFDPRMFVQPWMQAPTFPQFVPPYIPFQPPFQAFNVPFQPPFQAFNAPFMQPYNLNLPHQIPFRPFF